MRTNSKEVMNKVIAHVKEYYEDVEELKEQVKVFTWIPTTYHKGYHMAEGRELFNLQ